MKNTRFNRKFQANNTVAYCGKTFRVTHAEPHYRDASNNLFYEIHRGQNVRWVRADRLTRIRGRG